MHSHIKRLITGGEDQHLDFKFEVADARKIARSLAAFANTEGGRLLIGVKDNGKIAGIRSEEEYYMVEAAAQLYCKPAVYFETVEWSIEKKKILEIIIPRSDKKPHYAPQKNDKYLIYIRVNDQNLLANNVLIKVWKREKQIKGTRLRFTDNEKLLLSYLRDHAKITLSRFIKEAKISKRKAETILVNLILLNIVEIHFTEKGAFYTLSPEKKEQDS